MASPKDIVVSTTSTLQGWEIKKYIRPISSHLVAGTNLFSDFLASFSDVFGGRSETYKKQITGLYNDTINELKARAFELGANCVIGVSVDMDEISGKGKSMFMVTATGTAVIAVPNSEVVTLRNETESYLTVDELNNYRRIKLLIKDANDDKLDLSESNWAFIIENRISEVLPFIFKRWKESATYNTSENFKETLYPKTLQLVSRLEPKDQYDIVYKALLDHNEPKMITYLSNLLNDLYLVDFNLIKSLITNHAFSDQKKLLIPAQYDKALYSTRDIDEITQFISFIEQNFKDRCQYSTKKQLLSNKEKEVWICECSNKNDLDQNNCDKCGKDKFGFASNEVHPKTISKNLNARINLLMEHLSMK